MWLVDSDRTPLAQCRQALEPWANVIYFEHPPQPEDWSNPPDVVFFSAELPGGAGGRAFGDMLAYADTVPLIAVARLRSLAQAVGYFRAGVADFLSLPLDEDDARERVDAALERAAALAMPGFMVELEPVDADPGEISLSVTSAVPASDRENRATPENEEDILAELPPSPESPVKPDAIPSAVQASTPPAPNKAELDSTDDPAQSSAAKSTEPSKPAEATEQPESPESMESTEARPEESDLEDDEPVPVDGLPIPLLWDELPCGLLVFDSEANLAFTNQPGLELFGFNSQVELEEALENNRASFNALTLQQKPLPDNQWPHLLAAKTRTPRSSLISIEKPDKRRVWLRIDCRPHLHEGNISRLLLTAVNLTGELPPISGETTVPAPKTAVSARIKGKSRRKSRGRK